MTPTDNEVLRRQLHDEHAERILKEWRALIDSGPAETDLQKYLEQHPMLLPGGRGDIGPGGHHGAIHGAVFRQPRLTGVFSTRSPDFMWITGATDILTPVCIEIETPSKRWFTKLGGPSAEFTQAQNQLAQWRGWFKDPLNETWFRRTFLPTDLRHRSLEPQFVLVFGRQAEFTTASVKTPPDERLKVRRDWAREGEHLRTFDSLIYDPSLESEVSLTMHDDGSLEVHAIPPTFVECGDVQGCYVMGSPTAALGRSSSATQKRAPEIEALWSKQTERGRRLANGQTDKPISGLGPIGD